MRKFFTIVVVVLLIANVFAQSPEKMSCQTVIRDESDNLITDVQIGMQMSVLQDLESRKAESVVTHHIGEQYGGGVIFHLWKDNAGVEHGLIVALTDQSTSQPWSNVISTEIGTSAQSQWNGLSNSNAIVGQKLHTSSAAKLCLDLESGGYNDWYLPSIQELNVLWNNYYMVVRTLSQIVGATQLAKSYYWSSSESNDSDAWCFLFGYGSTTDYLKLDTYYVRAVRAF